MVNVSRETEGTLRAFAELVLKWNKSINLISKSSTDELYDRHIIDSLQIAEHVTFADNWLDLGSGGGFPGIVLAIAAKGQGAATQFNLVESDQRKCAFLRTAALEFDLNLTVTNQRIEAYSQGFADHISARALAPLDKLLTYSKPYFGPHSVAVFPKGQNHQQELAEARNHWTFDAELIESSTQASAALIVIRNLQ